MREAARILGEEKFHCIQIDLEGRAGPGSFIANLIRSVPKNVRESILTAWTQLGDVPGDLARMIKSAQSSDSDIAVNKDSERLFRAYWEMLADTFLKQAQKSEHPIILFLDELPFFCADQLKKGESPEFIEIFLATLRRWRQDENGIAMVISGSIGMRQLLRTHDIDGDHMNDLTEVWLEAPLRDDAAAMLDALANGAGYELWSRDLREAILDESADFMPSYLQKAFETILVVEAKSVADVKVAFEKHVRPDFEKTFFQQFNKRLERYGKEDPNLRAAAVEVMHVIACAQNGVGDRELAIRVASDLGLDQDRAQSLLFEMADDGFLRDSPTVGEVRFSMSLVERWFEQRFPTKAET